MPASTGTSSKKRRRIRPLLTEGRKKAVVVRRPKGTPTDAEWAKLDCLEAFVVEDDSENHAHTKFVMFRKGDDAIVNSQDNAGGNVWVGRIAQIRKRPDGQVWVKIFWYFSGNDTSPYVKSFHAEDCSPMERLVSDNYDLQQSDCFIAVTYMHEYCEADLDPPDLEPHQFFVRTKLYFKKLTVQPQLGLKTCICHRAYVLFPSPTAGGAITDDNKPSPYDADVMHFCPRPSCRRWYHVSCLQAQYFVDQTPYQYRGDRGVRRLAVNPDEDFPCPLLAWFCEPIDSDETTAIHPSVSKSPSSAPCPAQPKAAHSSPPSSPGSSSSSSSATPPPFLNPSCSPWPLPPPASPPHPSSPGQTPLPLSSALALMSCPSVLAHLPPALVRLAQCPIVRRPGRALHGWSAVGNVREAVLARRLVYAALDGTAGALAGLAQRVDELELAHMHVAILGAGADGEADGGGAGEVHAARVLQTLCDELGRCGMLASPYAPYWERRARELEEEDWMEGPWVVCPTCRGAI